MKTQTQTSRRKNRSSSPPKLRDFVANLQGWLSSRDRQTSIEDDPSDSQSLKLIVGLGNPGPKYALTRHNAGQRWVIELAESHSIQLAQESRFNALVGRGSILDHDIRLLIPTTFMNRSGEAVGSYVRYFKIPVDRMLVAYDEVAFPVGTCKLKIGGGHNGHNGLKSLFGSLGGNSEFARLRVGIGHPGSPDEMTAYLTQHDMPLSEREACATASSMSDDLLQSVLGGEWERAMWLLHSTN